jgi:pyruvate ferredoxin oxidoreductase beta subunit
VALVKQLGEEELFAPGHHGCAGCGNAIATRLVCKAVGRNSIVVTPTGCLEIISSMYPRTAWRIPWIHVAFENAAAVAAGVECGLKSLESKGKRRIRAHVVVIAGDGGTYDIGFQALSGTFERGHRVLYVCLNNEAYMNTGVQRSGATPYGAWTTTTPPGRQSVGKKVWRKNMAAIVAAHGVPYVATACISYPVDLVRKVKKGLEKGQAFIEVLAPCPVGWRFSSDLTIRVGKVAVETGYYPLYEIEDGKVSLTVRVPDRKPVTEFLALQGRFKHLTEREMAVFQEYTDAQYKQLGFA